MAVIRGDRIGESVKLNSCSIEAQEFFALFAASVPDDFGRFRNSPSHVAIRMYPRREPTPSILRRVARLLAELEAAGLWVSWTVDEVKFADLTNWKPTGNLYHRTPEPPGSLHVHTKRCGTTAGARAKEWGDTVGMKAISILFNRKTVAEPEQIPSNGRARVEHPSPPSPPSPPSLQQTESIQETLSLEQEGLVPAVAGTRPPAAPKITLDESASRYLGCFNAAYGRHVSLQVEARRKFQKRLKDGYHAWQIVALPILAYVRRPDFRGGPGVLLRDGTTARRNSEGVTMGACDWLAWLYGEADQIVIDERLAHIAKEFGVLERLQAVGVGVRKESGL